MIVTLLYMSLELILKILDIIIMSSESSTSELKSPVPQVVKVPKIPKAPKVPTVPTVPSSKKVIEQVTTNNGIVDTITSKFNSKHIKYIVIGVLILGLIVYYVYTTKYKKDTTNPTLAPKQLPIPKQSPPDAEVQTLRRQLLQKQQESEHLLREREQLINALNMQQMNLRPVETMQNNGQSLDLNFNRQEEMRAPSRSGRRLPFQEHSSPERNNLTYTIKSDKDQSNENSRDYDSDLQDTNSLSNSKEKTKKKLKHPNDNMDEVQADESPQVAQHNLTQIEMDEIANKLKNLE